MKSKLVTTILLVGGMTAPWAAFSADSSMDSDADRSHPMAFVSDSIITTKIKAKLAADHPGSMKHIRVDTDKDGIVWLSGTANSQEEIDQAVTIARNTEGVKSVKSHLTVEKDR